MIQSVKRATSTLFTLIFVDQTAITLTFPLITLIFFDSASRLFASATPYTERAFWFGCCVALPNMINLFFAPLLSTLSDFIGRKKILTIEIASAFFFTLLVAIGIYEGILALVFCGFIVKGIFSRTNPTALAIIGDTVPEAKKMLYMSYLQFAIALGAAIGPILGGYFAKRYDFDHLNFTLPFLVAAGFALLNTCFTYFFMPETHITYVKKISYYEYLSTLKSVLYQKQILLLALILLFIQFSWSIYYQFMPPILKTLYAFDANALGVFIGMIAFWLALTTGFIITPLNKYLNINQLLFLAVILVLIGLLISLLSCLNFLPFTHFWLWFSAFPVASGDVIAYSAITALLSNAVSTSDQGKVMGFVLFIVGCTWALTGFLGGFLLRYSPISPLIIAPFGVLSALFFFKKGDIYSFDAV